MSGPQDRTVRMLRRAARRRSNTPLAAFDPLHPVYGRVHAIGPGFYAVVAAVGPPGTVDPVYAVGWACDDHWATEAWGYDGDGYANPYAPVSPRPTPPHLRRWPDPLAYADVLARAKRREGGPVMVTAGFRFRDGGFATHEIHAGPRLRFHFAQAEPEPGDLPVAVEVRLRRHPLRPA